MRIAALREPTVAARVARALWLAWAVIVWNVVFDHVIVAAGRQYVAAAAESAAASRSRPAHFENMDAWMRPAVRGGLWTASAASAAIATAGLFLVRAAARPHTSR